MRNDLITNSNTLPLPAAVSDRYATFSSKINRLVGRGYWLLLALCGIPLLLKILAKFSVANVWDDSFMFGRYAGNFISSGKLSWNPGGEPTYGLTSNLFLVVVLPFRLLLGNKSGLVAILPSLLCGFLFLTLLFVLLEFYTDVNLFVRRGLILLLFFSFATQTNYIEYHFVDGMDTTFALSYLTTYLMLVYSWYKRAATHISRSNTLLLGGIGGLAFLVRPDLVLYTLLLPLAIWLFDKTPQVKRNAGLMLGVTVLTIAIQLGLGAWYFGSPLPLPFYAKALNLYGNNLYQVYADLAGGQFLYFLGAYWYLFLFTGLNIIVNFKGWFRGIGAIDKGLIVATSIFLIYYLFFVLPIMGYAERFYYPTLPALAFVGCRSLANLVQVIQNFVKTYLRFFNQARLQLVVIPVGLVGLLLFGLNIIPAISYGSDGLNEAISTQTFAHFRVDEWYLKVAHSYWFRLDQFSALPDDLVIATTEVGYPAAMNPHKTIVDMAGLNETNFSHRPFSADLFFRKYQPDLIYMPHPDYKLTNEQLRNNPYFSQHYVYSSASQLGTDEFGVAIWKDSKYYQKLKSITDMGKS